MEEARKQAGLSGAELARRVGVSAPTMSEWRRGRVEELRAGDLLRLCENLDVRPWWLWFGAGRPRGEENETSTRLTALWAQLTERQRARLLAEMKRYADDNAEVLKLRCADAER
jgi:transcriptional regulator with XRE-family HTH domain